VARILKRAGRERREELDRLGYVGVDRTLDAV